MSKLRIERWLSAGLLLGSVGCSDGNGPRDLEDRDPADRTEESSQQPSKPAPVDPKTSVDPGKPPVSTVVPGDPQIPAAKVLAALSAASDCDDLLTRVQDDAIAKLMMQVELYKNQPPKPSLPSFADAGVSRPVPPPLASDGLADYPTDNAGSGEFGGGSNQDTKDPASASDTNTQVEGVDEADFVKVVDNGKNVFLLHGNTLQKLVTWPAAQTALVDQPLTIEGTPSEMFVTDENKAVIFSHVFRYEGGKPAPGGIADYPCAPLFCGNLAANGLKITVADVSTAQPKVEREIYYEGSYVSSRRYDQPNGDVVRAVIQSYSKYSGLFSPQIQWNDAWGRPYDSAEIASQLDEWQERTTASIRKTQLKDWFPVAQQVVDGKRVDVAPSCDSYFVPDPGLADYGLTHVLSLDLSAPTTPIGGVTIVGSTSTVYSNAERLVLAQPDYRWSPVTDFGLVDTQQTAFHVFALSGAQTRYSASGWLTGTLPAHNPQFGIDVAADGTLRVATTGWVRTAPNADRNTPEFWSRDTDNRVLTARIADGAVSLVGKSEKLGHEGESVQSARFIGDRAYVVTFRQTDPLIVLDVSDSAAPKVLGELEIPGFSQYVHPLDQNHLITLGQTEQRGIQLQLFDVTDPKAIPLPRTLDFGTGSSSEVSHNHKAFTSFEGGLLALPVYASWYTSSSSGYSSKLEVVHVDANAGFTPRASIDHSRLYADNGAGVSCGRCDLWGCYDYACYYAPELRRGHFVKGEDGKVYVYSFSFAGVLVHELAAPARPVASVGLPAPLGSNPTPWYDTPDVVTDAGMAPLP